VTLKRREGPDPRPSRSVAAVFRLVAVVVLILRLRLPEELRANVDEAAHARVAALLDDEEPSPSCR
jgi:hypothetical protein